jgi:hypothetical protein
MKCSQCQVGRAWDAQGRCRPCSIGNVNLGSPLTAAADLPAPPTGPPTPPAPIAPGPRDPSAPAVHAPVRTRGGSCSQCWIGVAWDEEGRCRPCSDGGVRLAPAAVAAVEAAGEEPAARPARRWFGDRR